MSLNFPYEFFDGWQAHLRAAAGLAAASALSNDGERGRDCFEANVK
jgi:hypothetical protein